MITFTTLNKIHVFFAWNKLFVILLLGMIYIVEGLKAQCPNQSILTFTSQAQLDYFSTLYPNCTYFPGSIRIDDTDITNLQGLQALDSIGGYLDIEDNQLLEHLNGLEQLQSVGEYIRIRNNDMLVDFQGMENLKSIGGYFYVGNNPILLNFQGLENLQSVGGYFAVSQNITLSGFQGLANLQSVGGYFYVGNHNALSDFQGLENLQSVGGYFSVYMNNSLSNFQGLENLQSVGGYFRTTYNNALTNFQGLDKLQFIGEYFIVEDNDVMTNLEGLDSLEFIGGKFQILKNMALTNLQGLENLQTIGGYFFVNDNNLLTDFQGLENVQINGTQISIRNNSNLLSVAALNGSECPNIKSLSVQNNPQLNVCGEPFICNSLANTFGNTTISNNTPTCSFYEELVTSCGGYGHVRFHSYYDLDENGIQDIGEPLIPFGSVVISPGLHEYFLNSIEGGEAELPQGEYTFTWEPGEAQWELSTTDSIQVVLLNAQAMNDTVRFGLKPTANVTDISAFCLAGPIQCSDFTGFEIQVINEGTTSANGTVWFNIDSNTEVVNYIDLPDTTDGQWRVGWHFLNQYPGQVLKKAIELQLPEPPTIPGEGMAFGVQAFFSDVNGFQQSDLYEYQPVISCDLNAAIKTVSSFTENEVMNGSNGLLYTISFQNPDNEVIQQVIIKDTLTTDLAVNTLSIVSSSHQENLSVQVDDQVVTFTFNDLSLATADADIDGSYGYVTYSVSPKAQINNFTNIENSATVYFGSDTSAVTNTTSNLLINDYDANCPPVETLLFYTQEEVDSFAILYPDCSQLAGNVHVLGNDIYGLNGLGALTHIGGDFYINNVDSLVSLSALTNLSQIGGEFKVQNNLKLLDFTGLENLDSIGGRFVVENNKALTNFIGLSSLTAINVFFNIRNNHDLENFVGLDSIKSIVGEFTVRENDNLVNFTGLENLETITSHFTVGGGKGYNSFWDDEEHYGNNSLINFEGLNNLELIGGTFTVEDNDDLESFSGLDKLTIIRGGFRVGDIDIYNSDYYSLEAIFGNGELIDFTGLSALDTIGGTLRVEGNNSLKNFKGLDSLQYLRGISVVGFSNADVSLENFNGLENINIIPNSIYIRDSKIDNFNGLHNVTSIGGTLTVRECDDISMQGLSSLNHIGVDFKIDESDISNFAGLSNLQAIGGNFTVEDSYGLNNFFGLGTLQIVDGNFIVKNNGNLNNFNGLNSFQTIGGYFTVNGNDNLNNFVGLESLQFINGSITINDNDDLEDLTGLSALQSLNGNYLTIQSNEALNSLSGLYIQDQYSIGTLRIKNNPQLSLCNEVIVCNHLTYGGASDILNNAPGCNNKDEILFECSSVGKIHHPIFYDLDENGQWSANEPFLPFASVLVSPNDQISYANSTNGGILYRFFGDYNLRLNDNLSPNWQLHPLSDSIQYVSLDSLNNVDTTYWPLIPTALESQMHTEIVNGLPRCNEFVTFDVMALNEGTTTADGALWFDIDPSITTINYIDQPDTIIGNWRVGWHFNNLYPGQVFKRLVSLQLPGPPNIAIGEILNFGLQTEFTDQNGYQETAPHVHELTVQCAYDPNDKLVCPEFPGNYALTSEELVYTIRFQNTGNAEAYNVVIRDELDENLDLSTFRYITSSHEEVLSTHLLEGTLTFEFRDIFLPDSTTNFDGSQGYVMYAIKPYSDLEDFVSIENTAAIYFDYNPAVITNTIENTIVSTFDFDEDGFLLWNDCDDNNPNINAGAMEIPYNGIDDDCNEMTPDDDLDGDGFGITEDCEDNNVLVNPTAIEILYNGVDDDCNELTLDDDLDQDGFGITEDCDDNNALVNSAALEIPYNGLDDDCNELTLDDDLDGDGFGIADDCDDNPATGGTVNPEMFEIPYNGIDDDCDPATPDDDLDGDGVPLIGDCDDTNPLVNYNMVEIPYNGLDDDCNIFTLDDDLDQDGYGIAEDCDDNPATGGTINPDAVEIPYNGVDDDCNNSTPDDDLDGDGLIAAEDCDDSNPLLGNIEIPYNGIDDDCDPTTLDDDLDQDGFVNAEDCDDNNALVNMDATEIPYNEIDEDCDETTLDDDLDQDGFGIAEDCDDLNPDINTDAEDIPNNDIDEDCDGQDLITIGTNNLLTIKPRIFPNPTSSFLQVKFHKDIEGTYELRAISGKLVDQNKLQQKLTIDLSKQAQGVYILIFKSKDYVWTEQVVKM